MKIALIADIHANLPALQVLLKKAHQQKAAEVWNLGDMVGYGPFPEETVSLLCERASCHVLGNYDKKAITLAHARRMQAKGKDPDKIFSFVWTCRTLPRRQKTFIRKLPESLVRRVGDVNVMLTHASPDGIEEGIDPRTPVKHLKRWARELRKKHVHVLVCGHTHEALCRKVNGVLFVNPGGAGRSFDGDNRAAMAILEVVGKDVSVQFYRLPYNRTRLKRMMKRHNFPPRIIQSLLTAQSLD